MSFETFKKQHDFLVCVDSDGCAMDTMDCKHHLCFGPCMVDEWELNEWREPILARWNDINLYTMTRGINRFRGLAMALSEIDKQYTRIAGVDALVDWAEHAAELSNASLERAIFESANSSISNEATPLTHGGSEASPDNRAASPIDGSESSHHTKSEQLLCLQKALAWSKAVNISIEALPFEKKLPFTGAKEGLAAAHTFADVAIVSSANKDAVVTEWTDHKLLDHVDILLAQDSGSKAHCIASLLKFGYAPDHVLMVGDAPGDLAAAEKNRVYYYPILVRQERESWEELVRTALPNLKAGSYEEYGKQVKERFLHNLGA